jgi:hypothetical protein
VSSDLGEIRGDASYPFVFNFIFIVFTFTYMCIHYLALFCIYSGSFLKKPFRAGGVAQAVEHPPASKEP